VLCNPVPVEALYDPSAAHALMLRNLLQRSGDADLDAVRAEGAAQGTAPGEARGRVEHARSLLQRVLARRGEVLDAGQLAALEACTDIARLDRWLDAALAGASAADVLRAR